MINHCYNETGFNVSGVSGVNIDGIYNLIEILNNIISRTHDHDVYRTQEINELIARMNNEFSQHIAIERIEFK